MSKQKKTKNISVEALKATLIKKKECNAKVLTIVESWIEGVVSEDDLISNLHFLNQDHFQDVIEERAISKICGYPLCAGKLKNIPSKQFHISTQLNKVFDITDRKNFCSNLCYKAARYLKDQLLTSPLWLRNDRETQHFKLLSLDKTLGSSGIEIDLGHHSPVKPEAESEELTSILKFTTKSLSTLSTKVDKFEKTYQDDTAIKGDNNIKENDIKGDANIQSDNLTDMTRETIMNLDSNTLHNILNLKSFDEKTLQIDGDKKSENPCNKEYMYKNDTFDPTNSNHHHKKTETFNCNTIVDESLTDNDNVNTNFKKRSDLSLDNQPLVGEKSDNSKIPTLSVTQSVVLTGIKGEKDKSKKIDGHKKAKTKAIKDIPSMVNVVIRVEQCLREWFTIDTLCYVFGEEKVKEMLRDKGESIKEYKTMEGGAPVDLHLYERYLMICKKLNVLEIEDSKYDTNVKVELKVSQKPLPDFSALKEEAKKIEIKVKTFYKGDKAVTFKENSAKKEEEESPSVLPLVDLHAQKALRRRIVLDRLFRVLSDLGQTLGLRDFYSLQEVRFLISTFNLSANNVTFKPVEWNLIALVIFKLLSIKNQLLGQQLSSEVSSKNLTLLLLSYQLDGGYLDRLAIWLTDIDYVLRILSKLPYHNDALLLYFLESNPPKTLKKTELASAPMSELRKILRNVISQASSKTGRQRQLPLPSSAPHLPLQPLTPRLHQETHVLYRHAPYVYLLAA